VLILDEVFGASADAEFEKKSIKKMAELIKKGSTVVLASHNLEIVKRYCDLAICINKGKIVCIGPPEKVVLEYLNI
jgi:lipopolysaccharide transport system ATP-binding protein